MVINGNKMYISIYIVIGAFLLLSIGFIGVFKAFFGIGFVYNWFRGGYILSILKNNFIFTV